MIRSLHDPAMIGRHPKGGDTVRAIVTIVAVMGLAMLVVAPDTPAQGAAAAVKTQLQTSVFHAGELAQRGTVVAASKTHIQHVMNCLEGPNGPNFVAAVGAPCQGQGNGIIPDLRAAQAAGVRGADRAMIFVRAAHMLILQARQSEDVNLVQPYAAVVANQLKLALAALP